ncbi:hypothetical protein [Jidongwangia harbinensis]|uniref:hypothetical protein n=1 Tax=Jidongwangia harbinensis TaxID=2878561 RepID=UPI001CD973FF|nr:hypothetical protein [Jidongwangia harbinensis]MCA2218250.1 hypothetical protein [Jidongwangia harbinensis]
MRRIRSVLAAAVLVLSTVLLAPSGAAAAGSAGLTFTGRGAARHPGGLSVTLSGTYSCGPFTGGVPDRGVVDLTVSQTVAGVVVNGYGYLYPTACDGAARRYAVEVTTFGEQGFRRGAAQWSGSGYVEGDGGMQHGYVPPTPIQIR